MNKVTTQDIITDYNRIYADSGIHANSAYYRWIVKILGPKPNTKILDVSCGEGIFLREILRLGRKIDAYGLDISAVALGIAHKSAPEAKIVLADGQRVPFSDAQFDYVTCLGSLEHYLDPESGLKELLRAAKKEAKFCIVLPNSFGIDTLLRVWKSGVAKDDFQIIERTATKSEWIALLNKSGFSVESVYASNLWPELFQEGTRKIKSLKKYLKRMFIRWFCPLNFAREFVFVCAKS